MRDRAKTIESLKRLAERPGTPQEGEAARGKLREMEAGVTPNVPPPPVSTPRWGDYVRPKMSPHMADAFKKNEEEFKQDLGNFFRKAGYVLRREPKPVTWEDMEGRVRRHIYRDQGDVE